jgi:hypothetical protein
MVQKGVMRAGPWGFAAGIVVAIGLDVYERTQYNRGANPPLKNFF